ncbi:MAG: hypothetical protein KAS77_02865 [Thermoplasmata archaeon]|nr:hypothetical protein [Thermoplasmata archaeon]
MEDYLNVLAAWILIFSIALTVVAAIAYSRTRNKRVLMVMLAFALFAVKGVLLTAALFDEWVLDSYLWMSVVVDTVIIVFLAMTVLSK